MCVCVCVCVCVRVCAFGGRPASRGHPLPLGGRAVRWFRGSRLFLRLAMYLNAIKATLEGVADFSKIEG